MISIIVPIYNVEKYLDRCIRSILAQAYTDIEIILVDDGSTDSSPAMCDRYAAEDGRVRVIHKKNGGLSSARNAGIDAAKGEYIGFVDSDDYISTDMYESLFKSIENTDGCISNCMYVRSYENGDITPSRVPHTNDEAIQAESYIEELLLHVGDVSACTKLFPREVIGDTRFPEGVLNEDLIFMMKLALKIKTINFVGSVGYYYFVREKSITSGYGKAFIDMQKNSLWVLEHIKSSRPNLSRQALRFALYQNMSYLLALPREEANRSNDVYRSAVHFVRKNAFRALVNKYLKPKERIAIFGIAIAPKTVSKIFKRRKRNK